MRTKLMMSAAALSIAMGVAAPAAFAQNAMSPPAMSQQAPATNDGARPGHTPGVGMSMPSSNRASNGTAANTRTSYAPSLPAPNLGPNATPHDLLRAARMDLSAHHTGAAQEALERAETRFLDRSVPADRASMPDGSRMVDRISQARQALGNGDMQGATQIIDSILMAQNNAGGMPGGGMGRPMGTPSGMPGDTPIRNAPAGTVTPAPLPAL